MTMRTIRTDRGRFLHGRLLSATPESPSKYHSRSSHVPVEDQAARFARVSPLGQLFLRHTPTRRAFLACSARVNPYHCHASSFGLAFQLSGEDRPCSIIHRAGQFASGEPLYIQILHGDHVEPAHQIGAELMGKVPALAEYPLINTAETIHSLATALTSLHAAGHATLNTPHALPTALGEPRGRKSLAVAQGSEGRQAHVDADRVDDGPFDRSVDSIFAHHLRVPAGRPADHAKEPLLADYSPYPPRANLTKFGDSHIGTNNVLRKIKELHAVVPLVGTEAGESRRLARLAPSKECPHPAINTAERVTLNLHWSGRQIPYSGSPHGEKCRLLVERHRLPPPFPRLDAVFEGPVVRPAGSTQPPRERALLRLGQVEFYLDGAKHLGTTSIGIFVSVEIENEARQGGKVRMARKPAKAKRMKVWKGWCRVNREGESVFGLVYDTRAFSKRQKGERIARVR